MTHCDDVSLSRLPGRLANPPPRAVVNRQARGTRGMRAYPGWRSLAFALPRLGGVTFALPRLGESRLLYPGLGESRSLYPGLGESRSLYPGLGGVTFALPRLGGVASRHRGGPAMVGSPAGHRIVGLSRRSIRRRRPAILDRFTAESAGSIWSFDDGQHHQGQGVRAGR